MYVYQQRKCTCGRKIGKKDVSLAHKNDERHNVQMGTTTLFSYRIDAKSSTFKTQ